MHNFNWAEFNDVTSFNRTTFEELAIFNNATFNKRAEFWESTFKKYIDFNGVKFKYPEDEFEAYKIQRRYFENKGEKDKSDEMFIRERRSLRKAKIRLAKEQLSESSGIKLKLKAIVNLLKAYGSFFYGGFTSRLNM